MGEIKPSQVSAPLRGDAPSLHRVTYTRAAAGVWGPGSTSGLHVTVLSTARDSLPASAWRMLTVDLFVWKPYQQGRPHTT